VSYAFFAGIEKTMYFDFNLLFKSIPLLLKGATITLEVSLLATLFGIGVGLILIGMRAVPFRLLNYIASLYISFVRGTPLLIQIFFVYYALPGLVGLDVPPFFAGVLTLSLNSGAFLSEVFRAGISAIPRGQVEAAQALGLKKKIIWGRIILPQVFIKILPPLTNELTMLVKASGLLSVITVVELVRAAQQVMIQTFRPAEVLIAAAVFFFIICFLLSSLARRLERRAKLIN